MRTQPDIGIRLSIGILVILGVASVLFAVFSHRNEFAMVSIVLIGGGDHPC